jgi:serine/threonine protein phosphatase 1
MTLTYDDTVNYGDIIAVGDIHARFDLLELLLDKLRDTQAIVIFLGDMVDRGGQDVQVLSKIKELEENPGTEGLGNVFVLMGNHESMLVDAVRGNPTDFFAWTRNGGNFEQFDEFEPYLDWIDQLPIYMTVGDTMFIHAGIFPGQDPAESINSGQTESLLWMRSPFLEFGPKFEEWAPHLKRVIFGHTPEGPEPYEVPQGICIDTGAFATNVLTAFNATTNNYFQVKL